MYFHRSNRPNFSDSCLLFITWFTTRRWTMRTWTNAKSEFWNFLTWKFDECLKELWCWTFFNILFWIKALISTFNCCTNFLNLKNQLVAVKWKRVTLILISLALQFWTISRFRAFRRFYAVLSRSQIGSVKYYGILGNVAFSGFTRWSPATQNKTS